MIKKISKREQVETRVICEAELIIVNGYTVRKCAELFGWSKSTVHKDMRQRLPKLNVELYSKIVEVLNYNLRMRHIRGGLATKIKYKGDKSNDNNVRSKNGGSK